MNHGHEESLGCPRERGCRSPQAANLRSGTMVYLECLGGWIFLIKHQLNGEPALIEAPVCSVGKPAVEIAVIAESTAVKSFLVDSLCSVSCIGGDIAVIAVLIGDIPFSRYG